MLKKLKVISDGTQILNVPATDEGRTFIKNLKTLRAAGVEFRTRNRGPIGTRKSDVKKEETTWYAVYLKKSPLTDILTKRHKATLDNFLKVSRDKENCKEDLANTQQHKAKLSELAVDLNEELFKFKNMSLWQYFIWIIKRPKKTKNERVN